VPPWKGHLVGPGISFFISLLDKHEPDFFGHGEQGHNTGGLLEFVIGKPRVGAVSNRRPDNIHTVFLIHDILILNSIHKFTEKIQPKTAIVKF
jgi:hypothetical protein